MQHPIPAASTSADARKLPCPSHAPPRPAMPNSDKTNPKLYAIFICCPFLKFSSNPRFHHPKDGRIEIVEFYNLNNFYRIPKIVLRGSTTKLAMDIILFDYSNLSDYGLKKDDNVEKIYDVVWNKQMKIRNKYVRHLKLFKLSNMNVINTDVIHSEKQSKRATKITQKYVDKCNYRYDDGDLIIWGVDNFTSKAPDKRRLYLTDSVFPLCELEFEGLKFPAPLDYMDMIIREAGDIWTFPNDVGTPKFFSESQLKAEYAKSYKSMKALGLISGE